MKILIISYFFAPSTIANAKRPFLFARGFLDAGWDVDVVSSGSFVPKGCSELIEHPRLTIQRLQDPLDSIGNRLTKNRLGKIIFALVRSVLWPDITVLWALHVARTIDFSKYDRVLVSILPTSMVVLGWIKRADFRWIFDYQETASPSRPGSRRSPVYRWLIPLFAKLQRAVLKKTDRTIFSTASYIQDYIRHGLVEEHKAVHIPLFYDDLSIRCTLVSADKFIISYFGCFSKQEGGRGPGVFLQALELFLSRNPEARGLTEFRFYGRWVDAHHGLVFQAGLQDIVQIS